VVGRPAAGADRQDDARRALHHSIALEPGALNPSHAVLAALD
jgi:hypothetical protein